MEYFASKEVAIAFTLLLVLPAFTYFAFTMPLWLQDQFFLGSGNDVLIWVIAFLVLHIESVGIAAFYRMQSIRSRQPPHDRPAEQ